MNDSIRHYLDISSTMSDEQIAALLEYASTARPVEWESALFMVEHEQVTLARDWLASRGDEKLGMLARILPFVVNELKREKERREAEERNCNNKGIYIENFNN